MVRHGMRKKKRGFLKRLFPHSPFLRKLFVIIVVLTLCIIAQNGYHFYQIKKQEALLVQEEARLTQEKEELEQKKADLQDPKKLEQKARDELGLVKPGEVPYVR